jgi:hypothetical protein
MPLALSKSMTMQTKKKLWSAVILSMAILTTGCGNVMHKQDSSLSAPQGSYALTAGAYDPLANGGHPDEQDQYSCPAQANILPQNEARTDGTDRYTVCASKTSQTAIVVHPEAYSAVSASGERLCAYPIQVVDSTHVFPKINQYGGAMFQCFDPSSPQLDFPKTQFNALVVVAEADQLSMSRCLESTGVQCPSYSYGKFRQ